MGSGADLSRARILATVLAAWSERSSLYLRMDASRSAVKVFSNLAASALQSVSSIAGSAFVGFVGSVGSECRGPNWCFARRFRGSEGPEADAAERTEEAPAAEETEDTEACGDDGSAAFTGFVGERVFLDGFGERSPNRVFLDSGSGAHLSGMEEGVKKPER